MDGALEYRGKGPLSPIESHRSGGRERSQKHFYCHQKGELVAEKGLGKSIKKKKITRTWEESPDWKRNRNRGQEEDSRQN